MAFIDKDEVIRLTNGGLDIIIHYVPGAAITKQYPKRKFKIRPEDKTASANIFQPKDSDIWLVTDFGEETKSKTPIELVMDLHSIDYHAALEKIVRDLNLFIEGVKVEVLKADYSRRPATDEENNGDFIYQPGEFTEVGLKAIFAAETIKYAVSLAEKEQNAGKKEYTWKDYLIGILKAYNRFQVESFTRIKEGEAHTISAKPDYPLFVDDYGTYKKVYQPFAHEKKFRFQYAGEKPLDLVFGQKQVSKALADLININTDQDEDDKKKKQTKLDKIIICSGESDSLNVAALGYNVVWLNSETAELKPWQFQDLIRKCEQLYYLGDIDSTGLKMQHKLGMKFLPLRMVELPLSLLKQKYKGKPCKDAKDYLQFHSRYEFNGLVETALPYQFWEEEPAFKRDGEPKMKYGKQVNTYEIKNKYALNFLAKNGFYRYKTESVKEGYHFIKVENGIVEKIKGSDIRDHIIVYAHDQRLPLDLQQVILRTTQINDSALERLPYAEIDFTDYDQTSQWMFFKNQVWQITKDEIIPLKYGQSNKLVWKNEIINHEVSVLPKQFNVGIDEETGLYTVEIMEADNIFLKFLQNTARMYWKKEKEGEELTRKEVLEQQQHLANRLYAFGYLLHRYKDPEKAWCVYSMDARLSDEGESFGGSGKSLALGALQRIMNYAYLDGRKPNLTKDVHIFGQVNENTDFLFLDDAGQTVDFEVFFNVITGDMDCNPKFGSYTLPFTTSPKIAMNTNFTNRRINPSVERRLLYNAYSDYYHYGPNENYSEQWQPSDDFGKRLFDDFDENQWNMFLNLMANCVQLYLSHEKQIAPPMDEIMQRNLKGQMGDQFIDWADVYFSSEGDRLNSLFLREEAFEAYIKHSNLNKQTANYFKKKLAKWCQYNNYELNPVALLNSQGRITRRENGSEPREYFYIRTPNAPFNVPDATDEVKEKIFKEEQLNLFKKEPVVAKVEMGADGKPLPF